MGLSRFKSSQSTEQVEKSIEIHKILTALPEIMPYPQLALVLWASKHSTLNGMGTSFDLFEVSMYI